MRLQCVFVSFFLFDVILCSSTGYYDNSTGAGVTEVGNIALRNETYNSTSNEEDTPVETIIWTTAGNVPVSPTPEDNQNIAATGDGEGHITQGYIVTSPPATVALAAAAPTPAPPPPPPPPATAAPAAAAPALEESTNFSSATSDVVEDSDGNSCLQANYTCVVGKCVRVATGYTCDCSHGFAGVRCLDYNKGTFGLHDLIVNPSGDSISFSGKPSYKQNSVPYSNIVHNRWMNALIFNGLNESIELHNMNDNFFGKTAITMSQATGLTFSFLMKLGRPTGDMECIISTNSKLRSQQLEITRQGYELSIFAKSGNLTTKPLKINVTSYIWSHIVIIFTYKPFQCLAYLNGYLVDLQSPILSSDIVGNWTESQSQTSYIGACSKNHGFANMTMAEFRFWEAELNVPEFISDLYLKSTKEPDEVFTFDAHADDKTNNFNKNMNDHLSFNHDPHYTKGVRGEAVRIGNNRSWIMIENITNTCVTDLSLCIHGLSIAFWIKIENANGTQGIMTGGGLSIQLVDKEMTVSAYIKHPHSGNSTYHVKSQKLEVSMWYHVAVMFKESASHILSLQIDGILTDFSSKGNYFSSPDSPLLIRTIGHALKIYNGTGNVDIDDMLIWYHQKDTQYMTEIYETYRESSINCLVPDSPCVVGKCTRMEVFHECQCSFGFYGGQCTKYPQSTFGSQNLLVIPSDKTIDFLSEHSYRQNSTPYNNIDQTRWTNVIVLNGVNESIELSNKGDNFFGETEITVSQASGMTFSFLMKLESPTGKEECIISTSSSKGDRLQITREGYELSIFAISGNLTTKPLRINVTFYEWIHIVIIFTFEPFQCLAYLNGDLAGLESSFLLTEMPNFRFKNQTHTSHLGACTKDHGFANMTLAEFRFWEASLNVPEFIKNFFLKIAKEPDEVFTFDAHADDKTNNYNKNMNDHLEFNSDPLYTKGVRGEAVRIGSNQQWIKIENISNSCATDLSLCIHGLSIAFWIKIENANGTQGIMTGGGLSMKLVDKVMAVSAYIKHSHSGYSTYHVKSQKLEVSMWYHVAVIFKENAPHILSLQIDGILADFTSEGDYSSSPDGHLLMRTIGHTYKVYNGTGNVNIDDMLIWYHQKDTQYMTEIYETYREGSINCLIPSTACVVGKCARKEVFYECDCSFGFHGSRCTNYHHATFNSQDLSVIPSDDAIVFSGAPSYRQNSTLYSNIEHNKWFKAISFNGVNETVELNNRGNNFFGNTEIIVSRTSGLTFSFLMKLRSPTGKEECIISTNSTKGERLEVTRQGYELSIFRKSGNLTTKPLRMNVTSDEWFHMVIILTFEPFQCLAYLNGILAGLETSFLFTEMSNMRYSFQNQGQISYLGACGKNHGFANMTLADFRFWEASLNVSNFIRDFYSVITKDVHNEENPQNTEERSSDPKEGDEESSKLEQPPPTSCFDIKHETIGHDSKERPKLVAKSSKLILYAKLLNRCEYDSVNVTWTVSNDTWIFKKLKEKPKLKASQLLWYKLNVENLTPGIYKIDIHVSRFGTEGDPPMDSMYVEVKAADIRAIIKGGSRRTLQRGNNLNVNAIRRSYDPDLNDKKDKSGMRFSWSCAALASDGSVINLDCLTGVNIGNEVGKLSVDTIHMAAGNYRLTVTVSKDLRSSNATQYINLVDGYVPTVEVGCLVNCDRSVVTGRKLSLTAICDSCESKTLNMLNYKWTFYEKASEDLLQHPSLLDLLTFRPFLTFDDGSVGSTGLVFKPNSLREEAEYCVQVEVTCEICEKALTDYCFITNTPPSNGTCQILPEQGSALSTSFVISCSNWTVKGESNPLLTYKYELLSPDGQRTPIYAGASSESPELLLSAGLKTQNFTRTILAQVTDAIGSFSETKITVQVYPPAPNTGGSVSEGDLVENLSNLTSGTDSPIEELLANGDDSQAAQVIDVVANVLNDMVTSVNQSDQAAKESLKEIRGTLIRQVSKMAARVSSTDDVRAMSSALSSSTSVKSQISEEALADASAAITNLVDASEGLLENSPEEVVPVANGLFGALANILEATQPSTEIVTEVEELKTAEELNQERELQERDTLSPEERSFIEKMERAKKQRLRDAEKAKASESTPGILTSEGKVVKAILKTLAPGEDPLGFETSSATIQAQRSEAKDIKKEKRSTGDVSLEFKGDAFGDTRDVLDIKTTTYKFNPRPWNKNADDVTSPVYRLSVSDERGSGVKPTGSIALQFKNTPPAPTFVNISDASNDTRSVVAHKLVISSAESSLIARLVLDGSHDGVVVTVRKDEVPTSTTYDVRKDVNGVVDNGTTQVQIVLNSKELLGSGTYYLVLQPKENLRRRRSVSGEEESNNSTSYSISMATSACRALDETTGQWSTTGCAVSPDSTIDQTECLCEADSSDKSFGVSVIAPPNLIDFSTVWSKFADLSNNAAVFSTVISILLLYLVLVFWLRFQDKKDMLWDEMRDLADNSPTDSCSYMITVETGYKVGAGTRAHIRFILSGSNEDTGVRNLLDEEETTFPTGKTRMLHMTTKRSLGDLTTLRIWHNSPTGNTSWYLNKVTVEDLNHNKKYIFLCYNWLALNKGDGRIDRTLFAAPKAEVSRFSYIFGETSKQKLYEHHMLVSIFYRPVRNNFTRVQRLSCFISFLFLTMITSCMFYKTEDNVQRPTVLKIGPLSFSVQELFVSVISILIVFPVNLLVIQIFRKTQESSITAPRILNPKNHSRLSNESITTPSTQTSQVPADVEDYPQIQDVKNCGDMEVVSVASVASYYSIDATESTTSYSSRVQQDSKPKLWPAWLRIIAWLLITTAILVSAFFVILYSMDWGPEKSNQWLTAFILSSVEQLFILDPLKILIITLALTMMLKKTAMESLGDPDTDAAQKIHKTDLTEEELLELRRQEAKTKSAARALVRDIVAVCLLGAVVFCLSYVTRDSSSYHLHQTLHDAFVRGSSGFSEQVTDREAFFSWLKEGFVPNYFVETDVNGNLYHWRQRKFLKDRASYRVGPARLRQIRAEPVNCTMKRYNWGICRSEVEDKKSFGLALQNEEANELRYTSLSWNYQEVPDGMWHSGQHSRYPPGGFVCEFDLNRNVSTTMIEELEDNFWLDRWTRAVLLEFTVYSNNLNLFGRIVLAAESPDNGAIFPSTRIDIFRVHGVGLGGIFTQILEVLFVLLFLYNIVIFILNLAKTKCKPSVGFTFIIDMLALVTSGYLVIFYALRYVELLKTMNKYKQDPSAYVEFGLLADYDSMYRFGWGFMTSIVTIKLCTLLKLNKRFARLGLSLQGMANPLMSILLQTSVVYIGMASIITLWYMTTVRVLSDITKTSATMFSFSLGSFDELEDMMAIDPVFTPIFFTVLMVVMNLMMVNCFITVIMDAHTAVEDAETRSAYDYELLLFLKKDINNFIRKKIGFGDDKNAETKSEQ